MIQAPTDNEVSVDFVKLAEIAQQSEISSTLLADVLGTDTMEIAESLGIGFDALQSEEVAQSRMSQTRLRELVEILVKIEPLMGSANSAFTRYRNELLPNYGASAEQLIKEGRANSVCHYIDRMTAGGYN